MVKRTEVREHLIELFEQTDFDKETPEQIADAVLWVENEDGVMIVKTPPEGDLTGCVIVLVEPLIEYHQDPPKTGDTLYGVPIEVK